jgi:hypothetical protein
MSANTALVPIRNQIVRAESAFHNLSILGNLGILGNSKRSFPFNNFHGDFYAHICAKSHQYFTGEHYNE